MCVVRDDADWEARTNAMGETTGPAPQPDMSNERIDSAKSGAHNRNSHGGCGFVPRMSHLVHRTRIWPRANRYSGTLPDRHSRMRMEPFLAVACSKKEIGAMGCAHRAEDWSRIVSVGSVTTTATDQTTDADQRQR
jgi:hypothetical protein